ncbi:MAG: nitroreductase family protein [Candidatus Lokiarchaeota archaeon]|nr:nitroreductase family protein [Candidatus Lokiarchaeota archaeon]
MFSKSIIDIIKERTSWRTYTNKLLEDDTKEKILQILQLKDFKSPFSGNAEKCRFELISVPEFDPEEKKKIGTYGIIKGAQEFIVGATEKADYYREDYGYLLEAMILSATDLGLGTCWLGGFFNKSLFSTKINCQTNEIVPAITPIGYQAEKRRKSEKYIRSFIKADVRYSWDKLFFETDFSSSLSQKKAGKYETLLEMIRLGPSAGNKQPWRVVKEEDKDNFHFYVKFTKNLKNKIYNQFVRLDIGIAICHFDLTAQEVGLKGKWEFVEPKIRKSDELAYVISWISE